MNIASDFVLVIVAGLIGGLVARALRLPLLVGYVAAGILVGPYTAGPTVLQVHDIEALAEIGVALVLFSLGLEMSFRDLKPVRRIALIGGPIQILVTLGAFGLAGSALFRMPAKEAIWFGAMISLSSSVVVLKMLSAAGLTNTLASRVMIGLLIVQDLAVVPMLIILPQLGNFEDFWGKLARALGIAAVFLVAVVLLGTKLLPRLLNRVLKWGSRELFLVCVVAIGTGVGFATQQAGLSFALGAFIAGLVLSESEYSHQALSDVTPVRDIFGLLFFVTVGMLLDPNYALTHIPQTLGAVGLILAGKALIVGLLTRACGDVNLAPWIVGLGLSQVGEFSFVLARMGVSSEILSKSTYDLALTCTVLTMGLSPLVYAIAPPMGRAWRRWRKSPTVTTPVESPRDIRGHIVLGGYGRSGKAAASVLQAGGIPVVTVELDHSVFGDLSAAGLTGVWGDITSPDILHAAHIEGACLLLLTMPDPSTIHLCVERAKQLNPGIILVVRAVRERDVAELTGLGVNAVVQPEFEGGIEMVRQALLRYQCADATTARLVDTARMQFYGESAVD